VNCFRWRTAEFKINIELLKETLVTWFIWLSISVFPTVWGINHRACRMLRKLSLLSRWQIFVIVRVLCKLPDAYYNKCYTIFLPVIVARILHYFSFSNYKYSFILVSSRSLQYQFSAVLPPVIINRVLYYVTATYNNNSFILFFCHLL
jgi:hypothetical protein